MRQTSVNYARVLAELSVPADDLRNAAAMLKGTPALKQMLENPLIPREQKEKVIDRVLPESVRNFLKVACLHERTGQIEEIFECYEEYLRRQDGILRAELTCVTPPSEEQLQGMKKYLCRRYRKNDVTFDIREDASLLGGFILKAGDFEYDYSLDGRLKRLQHKLTRR